MQPYLDDALNVSLFVLGDSRVTPKTLLGVLTALLVLQIVSNRLRRVILYQLRSNPHIGPGTGEMIASLARYTILVIGAMVILEEAGIRLSSFTVIAGAVGVGVGFGLQNIFSNFVSGLIVMFERPIRLGDHVAIAGYEGDVIDIGMRATSLRTAPGSVVIVPNQSLITGNVVNWDSGVSGAAAMQWRMSGSVDDSESLVKNLLESHPGVLKLPAPSIYIVAADHAGHVVEAHFNVAGGARNRLKIISDLNRRVLTELERCGRHLAPNP